MSRLPVTQWRDVITVEPGLQLAAAGWIPEHPRACVLLAHGHAEHLGRYGHVVAALVSSGFAVYGLDHRGHGRSSGTRALIQNFDQIADDLHTLAIHAATKLPTLPVVLLGHSMGGLIALRYALNYQHELAALVTSGPAVIINEGVSPVVERVGTTIGRIVPIAPMPRQDKGGCGLSTEKYICKQFRIDHRNWHGDTRLGTVAAMLDAAKDTRDRFAEISVPLLAMHGADDTTTFPRGSQLLYDGASSDDKKLIMWEGRKHEIFNSPGRDAVIDAMLTWLNTKVPS
jgi:alpha-beta hydrolase superfamily lysophospholipase